MLAAVGPAAALTAVAVVAGVVAVVGVSTDFALPAAVRGIVAVAAAKLVVAVASAAVAVVQLLAASVAADWDGVLPYVQAAEDCLRDRVGTSLNLWVEAAARSFAFVPPEAAAVR